MITGFLKRSKTVLSGLLLISCTQASSVKSYVPDVTDPSLTALRFTATAMPVASTSPQSVTSTVEVQLIPTSLLLTPPFPESTETNILLENVIFSGAVSDGCTLPCWEGLEIGQSTSDDFQWVFDNVFGFKGSLDFVTDNPLDNMTLSTREVLFLDRVPELNTTGYVWEDKTGTWSISIVSWFTGDWSQLQGLVINWRTVDTSIRTISLSPQRVLRELGSPTYAFAYIENGGRGAPVDLMLIYKEGITFLFNGFSPMQIRYADDSQTEIEAIIAEFCLSEANLITGGGLNGYAFLSEPFPDGLTGMSPLQELLVGSRIQGLKPVEEAFGLTTEELAQLAVQEESCIFVEFPQ